MDYQDNENGLKQLLGELELVHGTYPPVYRSRGMLIGYDKLGRLRVLAAGRNEPVQSTWLDKALKVIGRQVSLSARH